MKLSDGVEGGVSGFNGSIRPKSLAKILWALCVKGVDFTVISAQDLEEFCFPICLYFCSGMIFDLPLIFVVECALTALDQEVHAYMRSTQPMRSHDPVRRHYLSLVFHNR